MCVVRIVCHINIYTYTYTYTYVGMYCAMQLVIGVYKNENLFMPVQKAKTPARPSTLSPSIVPSASPKMQESG